MFKGFRPFRAWENTRLFFVTSKGARYTIGLDMLSCRSARQERENNKGKGCGHRSKPWNYSRRPEQIEVAERIPEFARRGELHLKGHPMYLLLG